MCRQETEDGHMTRREALNMILGFAEGWIADLPPNKDAELDKEENEAFEIVRYIRDHSP